MSTCERCGADIEPQRWLCEECRRVREAYVRSVAWVMEEAEEQG